MAVLGNPQLSAILLAQVTSIAPSQYKTEKVVKNLDSGSLSPPLSPSTLPFPAKRVVLQLDVEKQTQLWVLFPSKTRKFDYTCDHILKNVLIGQCRQNTLGEQSCVGLIGNGPQPEVHPGG